MTTEWGRLHARVTKEEQDKVRLRAAELGMGIAEYLRTVVFDEIATRHLDNKC